MWDGHLARPNIGDGQDAHPTRKFGIFFYLEVPYNELIAKREPENLTNNEHKELLYLTEQIEQLQTQRIEYLADLARLRGISLTALMKTIKSRWCS
ncbi:MAG: hypothetical protein V7K98_03945 [Nostoc sp.]|uniref:hypothetical protein n=1 Tax=Nostoc sp. TaxID=1180 RepID=UPI002FF71FC6